MSDHMETEERDGVTYLVRPKGGHDRLIFGTNVQSRVWARRAVLKPEDVWLDVGAHVGYFAMGIAPYVKKVVCYEPDPVNLDLLFEMISINRFEEKIEVVPKCLGATAGKRDFYQNDALYSGASIGRSIRGRSSYQVDFLSVTDELDRTGANKIKMNCEGGEVEIIPSADLSRFDFLEYEFHSNLLADKDGAKYGALLGVVEKAFPHVLAKRGTSTAWLRRVFASRTPILDSGNMKTWLSTKEGTSHEDPYDRSDEARECDEQARAADSLVSSS